MAPSISQKAFTTGSDFPAPSPGKLRLYSMRFCPYAQRARLVLAHKGIEHEVVNINLKNKPEWYPKKVMTGKVPALELDDKLLFESVAACEWLDDVYPDNKLTPSDPYRKARHRMMFDAIYSNMVSSFGKLRNQDSSDFEEAVKNIEAKLKVLELILSHRKTPYFGGDQPAMVDLLMWPHFERFPVFVKFAIPQLALTEETFPHLAQWFSTMLQTPAVKACAFDVETHTKYLLGAREGNNDYDLGLQE